MIDKFDSGELADMMNDERKLESMTEVREMKTCNLCRQELDEEELDLVNGDWICRECERDMEEALND